MFIWRPKTIFDPTKSTNPGLGLSNNYRITRLGLSNNYCITRVCLQTRHLLCLQPRHLLCLQPRDLQSAKTSPGHCGHRGGRFAAAPAWTMERGCLGRLQISCPLTQQMSGLQTHRMSCLQTQQMSCLQTHSCNAIIVGKPQSWICPFGWVENGFRLSDGHIQRFRRRPRF